MPICTSISSPNHFAFGPAQHWNANPSLGTSGNLDVAVNPSSFHLWLRAAVSGGGDHLEVILLPPKSFLQPNPPPLAGFGGLPRQEGTPIPQWGQAQMAKGLSCSQSAGDLHPSLAFPFPPGVGRAVSFYLGM